MAVFTQQGAFYGTFLPEASKLSIDKNLFKFIQVYTSVRQKVHTPCIYMCTYRDSPFDNPLAGVEYHLNKNQMAGMLLWLKEKAIIGENISF